MKLKDGRKVKLKWRKILHPKQIWGIPLNNIHNDYMWITDEVGTVVMWIAFIISFPILVIGLLLYFPITVIRFKHNLKKAPEGVIEKETFWKIKEERKDEQEQ